MSTKISNSVDKDHTVLDPKLFDTQAGFRKVRECRDNILILNMAIQHLLQEGMGGNGAIALTLSPHLTRFCIPT